MGDDLEIYKVVYHINEDDPSRQASILRNIQNHIDAIENKKSDIRVVLHGDGLSILIIPVALKRLKKFNFANAHIQTVANIDALKLQGVNFKVCSNTIINRGIDIENDLYDVESQDIVKSGINELVRLQNLGYVYIKP
tara:strand:- start:2 stop:415 length:414 start_codon:yes stop_codon:yes gene_type:complete